MQFGSALGLGIGLFFAVVIISDLLGAAPARLSDLLYQAPPASRQVILIVIDDASLKEIGPLPWSRATLAALVDAITAASPRVLGLDLILPDPSRDDDTLARALERAPQVIQPVVGVEATRYPLMKNAFPRFDFVLAPAPALRTGNTRLANAMIVPDSDGIVRHIPLAIESADTQYATFGIAALAAFQKRAPEIRLENRTAVWNTQRLPVDAQGQMKIIFASPATQPVISAAAVLRGRADLTALRDKIVLIGVMSSAMPQHFTTPVSSNRRFCSVELHANVIETLLRDRLLLQQDRLTEIVMIFLVAILAGATLPHFRLLSAFALTIIYFLLYLGYAFAQFNFGVIVQPLYPLIALLLVFIGAMTFRYFSQERRRATLTRLFRRYVAPEAVDQVTRDFDQGALPLGGVRRQVSVLCVDLRDLTHFAASLSPEALFRLLNQIATLIVAIIFRHNGTITKHTGAEIMATWNLLLEQPDHARQAMYAALEIKDELAKSDQKQIAGLKMGIGITTGEVIAGRLGSAAHAEYTIIGEIISIAERLAVKPERGIFIDAATYARIGEEFQTREVKPLKLRRETDLHHIWQIVLPSESKEEMDSADLPANEI
ncbi:MAG: adenylate/guanylate cyclase domain-containing protein [Anaerolineales bacterium]|nr:adenylate/guanylate cyclase domain-containing protein [Anaerolineales bacterium]